MIEARHLRVLRAVARTGSFSAAARELGYTQPAVSQQMKALEKSVGTPLVVRVGRGVQLSEAGQVLVRHAAGILAGLTAAEEELAAIAGLRTGRVRLVSFPTASSTLVPPAVAAVRRGSPGIRVSLTEAEPPESLLMLRGGDCEVALAFRYPGQGRGGAERLRARAVAGEGLALHFPEGDLTGLRRQARADAVVQASASAAACDWSDLVVRPLLEDRLVGVVPVGHPLAGRGGDRPVALDELAGEQWIAGCPQCRGHLVDMCAEAGFAPRIDFATDDYPAVLGLVAAGLGVAVLPELALASARSTGVSVLPLASGVFREIVALTLPDLAQVPAVALMLDRLSQAAPAAPRG
ncbi:LysR family transcriptional regulator [Streptacidiphilus sp. N1-3]|uniref:LysR family transcriptional regulator n=1 Tax=Streptacidiphilus alkalitolerans TaxID=3342712 RepID=A0ABV6X4K7_9ACTN